MSAYVPTGSSASKEETYWKQQVRYIMKKGLKTNPKEMFHKDLLRQLRQWRSKRELMVLMMDANKDVTDGVMYVQATEECIYWDVRSSPRSCGGQRP